MSAYLQRQYNLVCSLQIVKEVGKALSLPEAPVAQYSCDWWMNLLKKERQAQKYTVMLLSHSPAAPSAIKLHFLSSQVCFLCLPQAGEGRCYFLSPSNTNTWCNKAIHYIVPHCPYPQKAKSLNNYFCSWPWFQHGYLQGWQGSRTIKYMVLWSQEQFVKEVCQYCWMLLKVKKNADRGKVLGFVDEK